MFTIF